MNVDLIYNETINTILKDGEHRTSRAGDTIGMFDLTMKFDLRDGFPLLSGKKINFDNVYAELMWFLRGESNIKTLRAPQLWQPWANENGDCGRIYGVQWIDWHGVVHSGTMFEQYTNPKREIRSVNQIQKLIDTIKANPSDRRLIVTAWNPGELDQQCLPACHAFFQCYVSNDGHFDLSLWQRSCDMAIGVPYNIASYALLLTILAKETRLKPRYFNHHLGDAHIYTHHVEGLKKQLARPVKEMPRLGLDSDYSIWDFARRDWELRDTDGVRDYVLNGYDPHGFIKFPLNV